MALAAGTMVAAATFFRQELSHFLDTSPVLGGIFLAVATVLGGIVLFILIQPVTSAVFCDQLSEVVEKRVRGNAPASPFLASTGRALVHGLLKLVLYGFALVIGLVLTTLTGVGALVGVAFAALFLAYDGFDYPLGRRSATFGGKWAYLVRNPGQTIGYGIGATLLYLIPLAVFVAPAFTAVGATLAYLETQAKLEAKQGGKPQTVKSSAENPQQGKHNPVDISAT